MGQRATTPSLDRDAIALVEEALGELHAALQQLLAELPPEARRATGLARYLGIDRTTCHRVVAAASEAPTVTLVADLPGIRALIGLADAAGRRDADAATVAQLQHAAAAFDELARQLAGSQTRLARAVAAMGDAIIEMPATSSDDRRAAIRARFHDAAAQVAGRWSEVATRAHLLWPADGEHVSSFMGVAVRGHHREPDAIPCIVPFEGREHHATTGAAHPLGTSFIPELTSAPAPEIRLHDEGDEVCLQVLEPRDPGPAGLSIALTTPVPHLEPMPQRLDPPVLRCWAVQHLPARTLVIDAFLHTDLARQSFPTAEVHGFGSSGTRHAGSRVHTRFPHGPRVEVLGRGLSGAACEAFDGHTTLLDTLFDRAGVDAGNFVGYRCTVRWPLWRCAYCLAFDFGEAGC